MARAYEGVIEGQIRTLFGVGAVAGMTDGQLLDRFLGDRGPAGEAAFESLVRRHGPMVLGVCRRILRDRQESEDAFQATFLVLARRAGSIRGRDYLGAWLLGVARKVASRARADADRRRGHERRAAGAVPVEAPSLAASPEDVDALLREVDRLPDRLRGPVVLFYLQGQSYERAALTLRTTEGALRGRLARARELLRARLAARGVSLGLLAPSGGSRGAFPGAIPPRLIKPTIAAATRMASGELTTQALSASVSTLMEGAMKSMITANMKAGAALALLAGALAFGAGIHVQARQKPEGQATPEPRKAATKGEPQDEAPTLADLAKGRIVRSAEVTKDCMILSYLPDWAFGTVDNIGIEDHDGGVRTLVDWPDVPAAEARSADLKFYLAFYSRKSFASPTPGTIGAFEVSSEWRERTSWKTCPAYKDEPSATTKFAPDEGWKLFEITSIVKKNEGKSGHGLMLKFLDEEMPGGAGEWSGYQMISREGQKQYSRRRPLLLVVEPTKK